jgi:predicted SAM-dependent methyltransferase
VTGVAVFRARLRTFLVAILPHPVASRGLVLWRRAWWKAQRAASRRRNRACIAGLLRSGRPINLELGSPKREGMEDWVASDIHGGGDLRLDLTDPMPFPDSSVQRIYSSHVLEHFSYPRPMLDILKECHRILQPGGEVSVAVPNARIFIEGYMNPGAFERGRYCTHDVGLTYRAKIDYVNFIAYMGGDHKHMFDEENLVGVLAEAGFREVRLRDYDPRIDLSRRRHESIYATGRR